MKKGGDVIFLKPFVFTGSVYFLFAMGNLKSSCNLQGNGKRRESVGDVH
jgi:hypothetical protein